ncbi:MAG: hypothetical protein ACRD0Y_06590 [Terriglobales bacterium]
MAALCARLKQFDAVADLARVMTCAPWASALAITSLSLGLASATVQVCRTGGVPQPLASF